MGGKGGCAWFTGRIRSRGLAWRGDKLLKGAEFTQLLLGGGNCSVVSR